MITRLFEISLAPTWPRIVTLLQPQQAPAKRWKSFKGIDSILSSPTMRCQRSTARSWPLPFKHLEPQEPVILLTGFADLVNQTSNQSSDVDLVLSKPARLDDLRKAIFEVMCRN